jgi:hypothetical protein
LPQPWPRYHEGVKLLGFLERLTRNSSLAGGGGRPRRRRASAQVSLYLADEAGSREGLIKIFSSGRG